MLFDNKTLDEHIAEMKNLGDVLMQYNFPRKPAHEESEINILKLRDVVVDGYDVTLHYNKSDHRDYYVCTLQVLSKNTPFLPFSLVCKIAKRFLGSSNVSLVQIFTEGRRVCCWTVVSDKNGKPIQGPHYEKGEGRVYEGFEYVQVNPEYINFY